MRFALTALCVISLPLTGCVGVTVGSVPMPTGVGVSALRAGVAEIEQTDRKIVMSIQGYAPRAVVFGPIIPVFPIISTNTDAERFGLIIYVTPKGGSTQFNPRSIRLVLEGVEISPAAALQSSDCFPGSRRHEEPAGEGNVTLVERQCFRLPFPDMQAPKSSFVIRGEGLPDVTFDVRTRLGGGLLGQ